MKHAGLAECQNFVVGTHGSEVYELRVLAVNEPGDALVSVEEASKMMGLDQRLVSWALDRELVAGKQGRDGLWWLPRNDILSGQLPLEEQFPLIARPLDSAPQTLDAKSMAPESAVRESATERYEPGARDEPPPALEPTGIKEEIASLRDEIRALSATISQKDATIAELARAIANMGEAAIERLPRGTKN